MWHGVLSSLDPRIGVAPAGSGDEKREKEIQGWEGRGGVTCENEEFLNFLFASKCTLGEDKIFEHIQCAFIARWTTGCLSKQKWSFLQNDLGHGPMHEGGTDAPNSLLPAEPSKF